MSMFVIFESKSNIECLARTNKYYLYCILDVLLVKLLVPVQIIKTTAF